MASLAFEAALLRAEWCGVEGILLVFIFCTLSEVLYILGGIICV